MTDERKDLVVGTSNTIAPFSSIDGFVSAQRVAKALMTADIVPAQFQNNLGNILVAMELANRTGSSILAVMQNIYIVHGKPGWSAAYCIAAINQSGRFAEPLHFEFEGEEGTDLWGCRAVTRSKTGKEIRGPLVTIDMAKKEGWYSRSGSKWQTMPELMLRYRAAAFFTRTEAPDILFGMQTEEELIDLNPPIEMEPAQRIMDTVRTTEDAKILEPDLNVNEDSIIHVGKEDMTPEWPKWDNQKLNWYDAYGVYYDQAAHAGFDGEWPSVNSDGGFTAGRGKAVKAAQLIAQAKQLRAELEKANEAAVIQEPQPAVNVPPEVEKELINQASNNYQEWQTKADNAQTMPEILELEEELKYFDDETRKKGEDYIGKRYQAMVSQGVFEQE